MPSNSTNNSAVWWQSMAPNERVPFTIYSYVHPVICIIAICGTITLLVSLISQRNTTKLSVFTHTSFCSLLTADAVFLLLIVISGVYRLANNNRNITDIHGFVCYAKPILQQTALFLQSYIQCVLSVHRILAISLPLWTQRSLTDQRMIGVLLLVFLFVSTTQFGFVFSITTFTVMRNRTRCAIIPIAQESVKYRLFPIIVECAIPSIVLALSTILIAIALIRRHKIAMIRGDRDIKDEIRLGVVLIIIDVVYLLSTVPVAILSGTMGIFYKDYDSRDDWISAFDLRRSFMMLRILGPATDWVFLLCLGNQVRHAFVNVVLCKPCRKRPSETQLEDSTGQSSR